MKGIILAGGLGTRLLPLTISSSKQLMPIYDKPMIYYPLSVLMLAGITEVLIIPTPEYLPSFQKLFGDGGQLGLKISYKVQPSPDGLAQAFILAEDFIGNDDVCLILGDNIFYGSGLQKLLSKSVNFVKNNNKALIFGSYVNEPGKYGVVEFDKEKKVISIEEKPDNPKSNYAVVGLYFYPNSVIEIAKQVKPSARGELEITSVNQEYLKNEQLILEVLSRGYVWLDTGTHEALAEATEFVKAIEKRTGLKIACLEEVALKLKLVSKEIIQANIHNSKGVYFDYIKGIIKHY